MDYILTIDIGTSSMRGIIYDIAGNSYCSKQFPYSPIYWDHQYVELSPAILTSALFLIMNHCSKYAYAHSIHLCGIAITSQRSSFIPVNHRGEPLQNIIMWQDQRTSQLCSHLANEKEKIYKKTGLTLSTVPLAPKIMWFVEHCIDTDHKTYKYLTIVDYLIFVMTGKYVTDYTYGSRTLLMDLESKTWNQDLLDIFHIKEEKLCRLIPQSSIIGSTTNDFNTLAGLVDSLPVITAGGDQQCSTLGAFCLKHGDTLATIGTGSYLTTISDDIKLTDSNLTCGVSAIPGKYHLEACVLAGSTTYNWYRTTFYPDSIGYDNINHDARLSPAGSQGIITLPHWCGKGSPDWNSSATGLFYGIHPGTQRGDFARSILEGIAFELNDSLIDLQTKISTSHCIKLTGGLTNIDFFNQLQANIYGCPTSTFKTKESTSLGALISGVCALNIYENFNFAVSAIKKNYVETNYFPNKKHRFLYEQIKKKRRFIYQQLFN